MTSAPVGRYCGQAKDLRLGRCAVSDQRRKADKRKTFYKTVSKLGHTEEFAALSVDDKEWQAKAEQLIGAKLKALKKKPDYRSVTELAQMVGPDTRALASECEKLSIFVGDRAEITSEDVRAIVTQGKLAKALRWATRWGNGIYLRCFGVWTRICGRPRRIARNR